MGYGAFPDQFVVLKDFDEDEMLQLEKITNNIINAMPILIDKKLDLFASTVNNK